MTAHSLPVSALAAVLKRPDIALACPRCGAIVAQLINGARPIQEQRVTCPQCRRASRYAKLRTNSGDTLQVYMRALFAGRRA
jgi:Zn finger protein HypA/HybF involved in hydrogenase expression